MTFLNFRYALLMLGLTGSLAMIPATASAKSSIHVDVPGFSIGLHDRGYGHGRRYQKHRRHYNQHRRHYRKHWRNHNRYYRGYNHYNRPHRSYDYQPRRDYYRPERCPTVGYSPYYYDGRDCYRHKDHFHCAW